MNAIRRYLSYENSLYVLLFMLPLLAINVRHWVSLIFTLMFFISVSFYFHRYRHNPVSLSKYERVFLYILLIYFLVFVLTSLIHPPESLGGVKLGTELHFLFAIPIYLFLRSYSSALKSLLYGSALSLPIIFIFMVFEVLRRDEFRFEGIYSPLFSGPITFLLMMLVFTGFVVFIRNKRPWYWLVTGLIMILATIAVIASHARVAYLGMGIVSIVIAVLLTRKHWRILVPIVIILGAVGIYQVSGTVKHRVNVAVKEITDYFSNENTADPKLNLAASSTGTRLELWSASPRFLADYPLFGVGNGNFKKAMQIYIDKGYINKTMIRHGHAHNVFVHTLMVKGLLGLVMVCLVFFYPLYVYLKTYHQFRPGAVLGIIFILCMFILSMNEAAPINKNNFVAIFLLYGLGIFSYHNRELKNSTGKQA